MKTDVLFIRGYSGIASYLWAALIVVLLRVAKRRYALVHAHGGETALVARLYICAPVVTSYLGSDLLAPQVGSWWSRTNCRMRSAILRRHASLMTATTTKTHEMESVLSPRARKQNRVIPDGIDLNQFRPINRNEARQYLGWSADSRIVLFAGRAESPIKRLWLARQAVELARKELPNLQLEIVSGVDPDEMPYYYSAADCLLHTSASEGSPNVIKEALACGLPIVATPAGDIRDLLKGAQPGGVIEADKCALAREIVKCCDTPQRSNGRTLTKGFDLRSAAISTVDLYRSIDGSFASRVQIAEG